MAVSYNVSLVCPMTIERGAHALSKEMVAQLCLCALVHLHV